MTTQEIHKLLSETNKNITALTDSYTFLKDEIKQNEAKLISDRLILEKIPSQLRKEIAIKTRLEKKISRELF